MSGPDDIPPARAGGNLVEALSVAQHLPAEALERAVRSPDRIADAVLSLLARATGDDPAPRDANLLFWGVHVLGAARDARLCAPLLRFLRQPSDTVGGWLGYAVGVTLSRVIVGCYDGDATALLAVLADPAVDEFVRWDLFGALAALTASGRVERETVTAFLRRFADERLARAGDGAWAGWADAVALLGLVEFAPDIQSAVDDGRLLLDEGDKAELNATLEAALAGPDDPARFEARGLAPLRDIVADLEDALDADDEEPDPGEPVTNPFRHVGRNDLCPCGSGLKFKKCCLPRMEAEGGLA